MLMNVNDLVDDTERMVRNFRDKQVQDKHFIDFKLTNMETIDLILTKAEA